MSSKHTARGANRITLGSQIKIMQYLQDITHIISNIYIKCVKTYKKEIH